MKEQTPFDLTDAVRRWREGLAGSVALSRENLDELEGHLRDSAAALQASGLTAEDAFLIARRRLGDRAQLEQEFGKTNLSRVWMDRCLWILAGWLLYLVIKRLSMVPALVGHGWVLSQGAGAHWVGATLAVMEWVCFAGTVAGCWWLANRCRATLHAIGRFALRWPIVASAVAILFIYRLNVWASWLARELSALIVPPGRSGGDWEAMRSILTAWALGHWILWQVLWAAALPLFAGYIWRKGRRPAEADSGGAVDRLDGPELEFVRRLRSQGLSIEEACSLANGNCAIHSAKPDERSDTQSVWIERSPWLLAGSVLSYVVQTFLIEPPWWIAAVMNTGSTAGSLRTHLSACASVVLGLGLTGVVANAVWRVVRSPKRSGEVAAFCGEHPWRAALLTALVVVGFNAFLQTVRISVPPGSGLGPQASAWFYWEGLLTHSVLPVMLLFWLAKRRAKAAPVC